MSLNDNTQKIQRLIDDINNLPSSDKFVTKEELTEAVTAALDDAKASGEFDGAPGEDGKTPVKGEDYWTPADQASIVQQVIAALPDASEVRY